MYIVYYLIIFMDKITRFMTMLLLLCYYEREREREKNYRDAISNEDVIRVATP